MRRAAALLLFLAAAPAGAAFPALQPLIDATPAGGVLVPPPGRYAGPASIDKPMTLDGGHRVTLDGGGRGTVLTLRADGVTVRNLHLTGSGESHDGVDAGLLVEGNQARIEANRIDEVLFGLHLKQVNHSLVRGNSIRGRAAELNLRGDGIRLWNSRYNRIEGNRLSATRDLTVANSSGNLFLGNHIEHGRYGMQFIFSPDNQVAANRIRHTTTGIAALYSDRLTVRGNRIEHVQDIAGAGLAFKGSGWVLIEGNTVLHCSVGLQSDAPTHPTAFHRILGNHFAHNITGLYFYGEKGGHRLHGNHLEKNLQQVAVSGPTSALDHDWTGNEWDDYQGFDRNRDGIGDTPYEMYHYADRIWMETPQARFFRDSPVLELLDFLERLAPFSQPDLILRDTRPRWRNRP